MANNFLTPQTIASTALGLLAREVVLPATVHRDAESDFQGRVGDTVMIRKPATLTAREFDGAEIQMDDIDESGVALELDKHLYSAVPVTDKEMTLEVEDFGTQVLEPQVRAVATAAEDALATHMNGLTGTIDVGEGSVYSAITQARKELTEANVPSGDRYLAVGPEFEMELLNDEKLQIHRVDASGGDDALREATLGRLLGFTVVVSNGIDSDSAVAYHRDAFALATRAPVVPDGAAFGQSMSWADLSMRWLRDYDSSKLRDRSIVSAFAGGKALDEDRALRITL